MTSRICNVPECGKPHVAQGLCSTHYSRVWRASGHRRPRTFPERFEANFEKAEGCWIWTGSHTADGYGLIEHETRRLRAHRVAYELAFGVIPDGLVVRHKCDNPPCVNPGHLELGTQADNNRDREDRGRGHWSNQTHCINGHALEGSNLYVNPGGFRQCRTCVRRAGRAYKQKQREQLGALRKHFTAGQMAEIRNAASVGGVTQRELAARFGCSQPTISAIVNGKRKGRALM